MTFDAHELGVLVDAGGIETQVGMGSRRWVGPSDQSQKVFPSLDEMSASVVVTPRKRRTHVEHAQAGGYLHRPP